MPAKMRLSYSKLEQYDRCPRSYYLQHILRMGSKPNFYSAYGSLIHDLLRKQIQAGGTIAPDSILAQYTARYEREVTPLTAGFEELADKYYLEGYDALSYPLPPYLVGGKILETEKKRTMPMFSVNFSSIIDVLFEDTKGRLVLMDHKSATHKSFYGQNGKKKLRQLYIYSDVVRQVYGKFPDMLVFNLFREDRTVEYPFSQDGYNETMDWAQTTVDDIIFMTEHCSEDESQWSSCPSPRFFCDTLCDVADECADHVLEV